MIVVVWDDVTVVVAVVVWEDVGVVVAVDVAVVVCDEVAVVVCDEVAVVVCDDVTVVVGVVIAHSLNVPSMYESTAEFSNAAELLHSSSDAPAFR